MERRRALDQKDHTVWKGNRWDEGTLGLLSFYILYLPRYCTQSTVLTQHISGLDKLLCFQNNASQIRGISQQKIRYAIVLTWLNFRIWRFYLGHQSGNEIEVLEL